MSVVVEGVETFEELAYLHAATRIQVAQGYYFARPMLVQDLGAEAARTEQGRAPILPRHLEAARSADTLGRQTMMARRHS